ncbi:Lrp/AsnC family transcriptional regulator [Aeromicrobium panaciterrae]|uniref:Lrp/AsnC family transcriptional regulator n=1 Tax=Aeromicrobium panaciterrae TaxID=363861 RepID=UPI0031DE791A
MDNIDRQLIGCLLEDGRASYAAIGDKIGLSAPAVKRRTDRLLADGVISGFTAVLDPDLVGWSTEAYVAVHCKGAISPEELRKAFSRVPEVHSAATISGQADAMLRIVAKDVRDLERALERVRTETSQVDHTETSIVLSRLIERHGLSARGELDAQS